MATFPNIALDSSLEVRIVRCYVLAWYPKQAKSTASMSSKPPTIADVSPPRRSPLESVITHGPSEDAESAAFILVAYQE